MKRASGAKGRRPKTWLITGLLASGALAYVVFIFLPGQRAISKIRADVEERRQQIMQAQTLTSTVAAARLRLASARDVGRQWRTGAPRQAQLITHFASLTQQAEEAGVAIERLDPVPAVELNLIAQQNVSMQFRGRFAEVFDFLRRLEALPGTLWIRELRLHLNQEDGNTLRGELTLTIFVDRSDYAN
jgi:Tfp pilus assembly protein PilO